MKSLLIKEAYFKELQILANKFNVARHTAFESDESYDYRFAQHMLDNIEEHETLIRSINCEAHHFYDENGYITMIQIETDDLEVWQYELDTKEL